MYSVNGLAPLLTSYECHKVGTGMEWRDTNTHNASQLFTWGPSEHKLQGLVILLCLFIGLKTANYFIITLKRTNKTDL